MEPVEIEAKTIDEAIRKACAQFQVAREKLNIEIIDEGTSGFLGLGAKKAHIRASLLNFEMTLDAPPARTERRIPDEVAPFPARRTAGEKAERKVTAPPQPPSPGAPALAEAGADTEPSAQKARRILAGILERMQIDSPVTLEETPEAILLNIRGDGSGLLIGKRGQNLDALQYIVNKAIHHATNGHKPIVVDTEEYRKRREESLVALAVRMGEKAKKTKKQVTIGHMNARDRRLIHLAMQGDAALTTKSRGEGEYRKIVILPVHGDPDQAGA
jgi:spoIIIJ-associated protein